MRLLGVLPNYIFTYNGNQYVRVTPYANGNYATQPDIYKFSDDSPIGRVNAGTGNSSNYRFFEIQPIKWIVLNFNYLPSQYGTGGNGTHTRLELLANDVLVGGVAPDNILWEYNTINAYLNNKFNEEAFPMTMLVQSTIYNNLDNTDSDFKETGSNTNYLGDGSNLTTQSIYLLSYYEAFNTTGPYFGSNKVFKTADDRIATASDYAKAHYHGLNATTGKAAWWTRTTYGSTNYFVSTSGNIANNNGLSMIQIGTRPAMQRGQECLF